MQRSSRLHLLFWELPSLTGRLLRRIPVRTMMRVRVCACKAQDVLADALSSRISNDYNLARMVFD